MIGKPFYWAAFHSVGQEPFAAKIVGQPPKLAGKWEISGKACLLQYECST